MLAREGRASAGQHTRETCNFPSSSLQSIVTLRSRRAVISTHRGRETKSDHFKKNTIYNRRLGTRGANVATPSLGIWEQQHTGCRYRAAVVQEGSPHRPAAVRMSEKAVSRGKTRRASTPETSSMLTNDSSISADPSWHEAIYSQGGGSVSQAAASELLELHRRCFSCCNAVLQQQASLSKGDEPAMVSGCFTTAVYPRYLLRVTTILDRVEFTCFERTKERLAAGRLVRSAGVYNINSMPRAWGEK